MNDLSIIIINWNTKQLLLDCVASVYATVKNVSFEIQVVDNGSSDGSVAALAAAFPETIIIANNANAGFARANNQAIRRMQSKYAVLLNSDTILIKGAMEKMLTFMEAHPDAGMCGPQLLNEDGTKQKSVDDFPTVLSDFMSKGLMRLLFPGKFREAFKFKDVVFPGPVVVDLIIGACMMVRKAAIDEVGMLDEDYFFLYEEADWCLRMKQGGWKVYHLPDVAIYHLGGRSMKKINLRARAESWRSRYVFFNKSMKLSGLSSRALLLLGGMQTAFHFLEYSVLNVVTLFSLGRLRHRWHLFGYLLAWHLRGRPISMCLPR